MIENRRGKRRIIILCEGETEQNAVRYFIKPQMERDSFKSIGIKDVLLPNLEKSFSLVRNFALEERTKAIFTLIDLYGANRVMFNKYDDLNMKIKKMIHWLKNNFEPHILKKFHPHLCVHETEAWFLAEEEILSGLLGTNLKRFEHPESIDFDDHPSKKLNNMFKVHLKRRYKKGGLYCDDRKMFKKMTLEKTTETCPYLKAFYDDLKTTAMKFV